mgnify:FL=1
MISSVENTLNEKRQEVVTENNSQSGAFSILFGLLSGSGHRNWDVAKIMTTNAAEVSQFNRRQAEDFKELKANLISYFKDNELAIVYAKVMAAKSLQLAVNISNDSFNSILPLVKKTAQRVAQFSFLGVQEVSTCTTTNYADRSSDVGIAVSSFLLSFSFSDSEKKHAYEETICSSPLTRTIGVSESQTFLGRVVLADMVLKTQSRALSLRELATSTAPEYPTWGSADFAKRP